MSTRSLKTEHRKNANGAATALCDRRADVSATEGVHYP